MPNPRNRRGSKRPGRKREPLSEGRRTAAKLLQKELSGKSAELQLFLYEELPRMAPGKRMKLEETLRAKRVLAKDGKLEDLKAILGKAVLLSGDMRSEASTGKARPGLSAVQRGFMMTTIRVAHATIMEAGGKKLI